MEKRGGGALGAERERESKERRRKKERQIAEESGDVKAQRANRQRK